MAKKSRKDMKAPSKEKSNFLGASGRNMPVGGLVGFSGEDFILTEQGDSSLVVLYPAGSGQRGAHGRNRHECRDYTCRKRTILLHNDSSLLFFHGWVLALYFQDADGRGFLTHFCRFSLFFCFYQRNTFSYVQNISLIESRH